MNNKNIIIFLPIALQREFRVALEGSSHPEDPYRDH